MLTTSCRNQRRVPSQSPPSEANFEVAVTSEACITQFEEQKAPLGHSPKSGGAPAIAQSAAVNSENDCRTVPLDKPHFES